MTTKKALLVEYELEFLESKLIQLHDYIESIKINELEDRIKWKETKNGGAMPMVIASKEAQRKDWTQALKDYAELVRTIKALREEEEKRAEARGGQSINGMMQDNA